jgi:hypothetical protein
MVAMSALPAAARDGSRRDRDDDGREIARGVGSIIIGAIAAGESRRRYRSDRYYEGRSYGYSSRYREGDYRRGTVFRRQQRDGH